MKVFFKYVFATIIGLLATGLIVLSLCLFFIVGLVTKSSSSFETTVQDNSIFVFDLNGSVMERNTNNPLDNVLGCGIDGYGLDDILSSIRKAKEIDKIKGIYINAENFSCGSASMQAIRNALLDFKKSGKFIVAYAGTYTQGAYYLLSVADKLIVNPSGSINWHGLSTNTLFYKGLMDKLGVEMQVFRVGTYKSAVEPYIGTEMSDANRRQTQAFVESIWNQILSEVSVSRSISVEKLNELADANMDYRPAEDYVKAGLADTLMYKDQVEDYLKQLTACNEDDDLKELRLDDMLGVKEKKKKKSEDVIAVYYACGEIDGSMGSADGIDSEQMVQDLYSLRKDKNVKAVVLRVNSPGGSAYGSEQIWREVSLLKSEKPVVVSMGDYAASGGYYISCAAHRIVAEPSTLTGSIGIFGMIPNAKGLVQDKLGLKFDGVKTNRLADMDGLYRPLNGEEKGLIQNMVNKGYDLFTKRCAEGRKLPIDSIQKVAEGRVWTGVMAKDFHLVDELGGLDDAIKIAGKLAKIKDYSVENYPEKESFLSSLLNARIDRYIQSKMRSKFGAFYDGFHFLQNMEKADRLQARMPFSFTVD